MIPLSFDASTEDRRARYREARAAIESLLADEPDWIAAMASVASELHHAFAYFDWTGFYRATTPSVLVLGPYQGGHGCLRIDIARGVCGAAARERITQRVDDVSTRADHIACSATTQSEIVVPIVSNTKRLLAVLDVDSNTRAAFSDVDQQELEALCQSLAEKYGDTRLL